MVTLFAVSAGKFYRNRLGQVVLITDIVKPGTKMYEKGFRYADQRGTLYTRLGTTQSSIWRSLNLTGLVQPNNVTDKEMSIIHNQAIKYINLQNRRDAILKALSDSTVYLVMVEVAIATLVSILVYRKLMVRSA
jgi:hypothetical protein